MEHTSSGCSINHPLGGAGIFDILYSSTQLMLQKNRPTPASYTPGGGLYGTPSKGHLGGCASAIYSETTDPLTSFPLRNKNGHRPHACRCPEHLKSLVNPEGEPGLIMDIC